ncbi:methyltransferase-like protein 22 isoform X2 [Xenia sp. Carnegie-2017]|uniref:methyltransferase-like protein 22 isoform X2 n=1 Tax=Xenia sp. Carnegie-2017 TaxID=2897299 RepID=UPI001F045DCF|nr:methyltransferase-like protein 22 isoform X2 [Xenia sp. Carnegie-2017]
MSDNKWKEYDSEEVVLSDVHLSIPFTRIKNGEHALSRIHFTSPNHAKTINKDDKKEAKKVKTDADGDFVVERSQPKDGIEHHTITIEHTLATSLSGVGTQIWRGSFLLSDYIVFKENEFDGCTALELGAGTGMCSVVMARVAKRVFCTDVGDVLEMCNLNRLRNCELFKYSSSDNDVMFVRELDFFHSSDVLFKTALDSELNSDSSLKCSYSWTTNDKIHLKKLSVVFASDVIYNDGLTDAFLECIMYLLSMNPSAIVYVSLEKRIIFTLEALDVVSPAYDYFIKKLEKLSKENENLKVHFKKLDTNIPQYFNYLRVNELELWMIHATPIT